MTEATQEPTPQLPATAKQEKAPILSGGKLRAIVPADHQEAYRMAMIFVHAGMVPESLLVKRDARGREVKPWEDGEIDEKATTARTALVIMKGMEINLPPVTAVSTIMIINNRPCLWGDGAVALMQQSGKIEYFKDWVENEWGEKYVAHFEIKRKDNPNPIHRTFSYDDAKRASLLGKKGPWSGGFGPRMCFNRARAWALRDGASDVLMGLAIVEEEEFIEIGDRRNQKTDTSDLDDVPAPPSLEHKPEEAVEIRPPQAENAEKVPVGGAEISGELPLGKP